MLHTYESSEAFNDMNSLNTGTVHPLHGLCRPSCSDHIKVIPHIFERNGNDQIHFGDNVDRWDHSALSPKKN